MKEDIDQFVQNEAFAAQALTVVKELGSDQTKLNSNVGVIALGSKGGRPSVQILNEMKRRNQKYGMVTACVGGDKGVVAIFDRL